MDRAKAMYLGGEIIDAHDCNYSSYYNDGLRCAVCSEPVFLKRGSIRKPHFAHHSGTDPQQVEECELRLSSYGNSSQINSFIKDRGQRLKLFQDHFLSLISFENDVLVTNSDFHNWINSIKRDYDKAITNVITNCTDYFLRYRYKIVAKYIKSITIDNNKSAFERQEIALEAISYLCIKSSYKLLEYLLNYSIYKLYKDKRHKLFKQDITTQDVDNICNLVIKIIMLNNWLEQVRQQVQKLVINNSALIIADQLNDYDKLKEHNIDVDKANKRSAKLMKNLKSLLNHHNYDTNLINAYASLLLTYFIIDCKFEQLQIAALIAQNYKLIPDDQISLEDKVLAIDPNKLRKQALQELIDQLLNKVDKPVKKLSNRRRNAIAKKQANTTKINKKGIVSLIKK